MAAPDLCIVAGRILKLLGSGNDTEEIGSRWGVPHELLQGLKETISKLAPLLLDAEKKSQLEFFVGSWLMELEDVVYDADNLLDELSTKAMKRSWMTAGNKLANRVRSYFFLSSRLKNMCLDLKVIRERLDAIAACGRDLHLKELNEKQVMTLDKNAIVLKEEVVSRDVDKLRIVKILLDDTDQFNHKVHVLPIVVEGVMGKTTLAKDVFNDELVQSHFDIRIWLTLSDNFELGKIVKAIFGSAIGVYNREVENLPFDQLHMYLGNILKEKLFLIVLDDLCAEDCLKWDSIKSILTVGANGSKVIVTTRSIIVASITGTREPYYLSILSEEQSLLLFEKMAFGQEQKCCYQIYIGQEIVKKCYRVPIVLKTIAGMLRLESTEAEWKFFYENEFSGIRSAKDNVIPLLKLCYDHLPSPLKHCFAYCSLFPKNHKYDVQTMIKLWMAQGFVIDQPGKSLEDVGYEYVLDLLRRFFFQGAEIDVRERVTIFQIHDLVHDLAISVAELQCIRLDSDSHTNIEHGTHCHVSIDFNSVSAEAIQLFHAEKIRSIVLLGRSQWKYEWMHGNKIFEIIASRFRFLRALDMHAFGIKTVPHCIGKLKFLKYLDLSENEDITELPNSITKLLNLQTLRLSSCFGLKEFPRDFKNLVNLRHLEIDGCYNLTCLPRGILQLPNLQTLSQLVVSEEASPNIGLNTLSKEVHIKNLGHEKFDMDKYLNVVSEVRSLSLVWESNAPESEEHKAPLNSDMLLALEELTLHGFRGGRLFSSGCPSSLVKLSLKRCVNCENLPPLDQLSHLKVLVLDEITKLKYISDNASSSMKIFPSLQELWLTELPELEGWWRNGVTDLPPSFHCLSKLVIEDCPNLASMPLFPTLEEGLVLDNTCWKPFQLTLHQKATAQEAASSSPSPPLSKLKALHIVGIEDYKADEFKWGTLESLRLLRFDRLPNLLTLPEGLQQVTSLQELHLWRCGIEEIPEWIGKLRNLEKLVIRICPLLKSLPKTLSQLHFLETLEIEKCNALLRRCEQGIGADWEKISSIPNLLLGRIYGR